MLPGKKYTPEDFLRIAWNRRWLILLPTLVIAGGVFAWAYSLPNRYRAETTILVVPQRVPEDYVRSTVTTEVEDRLQMISQQILSRSRLERIVQEFNLYADDRKSLTMEDVIDRMRTRDIKINIVTNRRRGRNDANSFSIAYESEQPRIAVQVTERLASLFVQENLEDRELLADATNQFLQTQLEDARRRLVEHEKKLEDFRQQNAGRLPTQVQSNLQMIQATQTRLQLLNETSNRERDRLATLEQALGEVPTTGGTTPAVTTAADSGASAPTPGSAAQQLAAAKAGLAAMLLRLKPEHPDVIRAKRVVDELQAKVGAEPTAAAGSAPPPVLMVAKPTANDVRLQQMRIEASEIRRRLDSRKQEEAELQKQMTGYSTRLEAAPTLESQLVELMRDYGTLQETYTTLLKKSEESKIAVNLERRQIGEQFRILDSARLPEKPVSPDRPRLNVFGLLGGLAFSLVIVGLLEYRDTTLKTDDDVVVSLALPVLAVIPAMVTMRERAVHRRRMLFALSGSVASLIVLAAVVAWRLKLFESWVR